MRGQTVKAAIYCRVSTSEQDVTVQEKICREYAERNQIEIYRVYTDAGVSGFKDSRPAFNDLLQDMRLMRFNCIMVTKLDRIGRSLQHILSLFEEFSKLGVHFIACTQNIDTSSAAGKLQLQIFGAFAEFERNIISERTREGLQFAKNVGKRGRDRTPRKKRGVLRQPLNMVENGHR
jgi:DNA invertase Pin-like site-specific DNA recombinase